MKVALSAGSALYLRKLSKGRNNIMKYINAADVLPMELLKELSAYVNGQLLYIPSMESKKSWGSKSGSKQYYEQRNMDIINLYHKGMSIDEICERFHLSYDTIRKIIKSDLQGFIQ